MASAGATAQAPMSRQQRAMLDENAVRLRKIGDRIRALLSAGKRTGSPVSAELISLVHALARGIDYAVSAGHVPPIAADVPNILRKVYELTQEPLIQCSAMVLVIACKNACFNKWFQPADSTDILRIANELSASFCSSLDQAANDISLLGIISKIMPRYYPRLKFERLVTSMEAKVGYNLLMNDFFIERNIPLEERIRLIVVQKENLDTSSCITNPPHVSFLINGKAVDKRTNVSMEPGPQFPTDITKMLKYGANIIQAIGYFDANCIIAIAFMKSLASFSTPALEDYTQPVSVDPSDSDVLEGPSRVSLKCPISLRRIKTPVKGHLCKHYQCFDYDNYIEMNMRKPTWRCPFCNTPSNFLELRIDQKIAKILQETGVGVLDVFLFAEGSWKVAEVYNKNSERRTVDAIEQTRDTVQTESSSSHIVDLISGNDDDVPMNWSSASEDTKPVLNSQDLSVLDNLPDFHRNGPVRAGLMSGNMVSTSPQTLLVSSSSGLGSSSFGTLEPFRPHPTIADAVSPLGISNSTSEVNRPIPRNPGCEAVGVQGLPVTLQNSSSSIRLRPNCPSPVPRSSYSSYRAHQVMDSSSVIAAVNNDGSLPRAPSAALLHQQSTALDTHNTSRQLPNRVADLLEPQVIGSQQSTGVPIQTGGANAYVSTPLLNELMLQNRMYQTAQAARGQTSSATQTRPTQANIESHASRPQTMPQAETPDAVPPRTPLHLQSSSEPTVVPSMHQSVASDSIPELPIDENWRPTGQMRGSLQGNDYNHAIAHFSGRATPQHSQARPPHASDRKRPR